MLVGVPKEIKVHEYRVGLTPPNVRELTSRGHQVLVESRAGEGIGANDFQYELAGAQIARSAAEVYDNAQLIVKVKEPLKGERKYLRPSHILFTYFHLAADDEQTRDLVESGSTCIAYETVTSKDGKLPLLAPMSEVAGRMSAQVGAHYLEKKNGGSGVLLGGVPGLAPAKVVILGGGVVGTHAIHIAIGMGADVWVLDRNPDVLRRLWKQYGRSLNTVFATQDAVDSLVVDADLVIGGVLLAGAKAPKLVSEEVVRRMRPGSVIVDVAIDQGGCLETSKPTTHDAPTYTVGGVIHYCVTNMPGAVPKTSAFSLNNATLPYILALAEKGWKAALSDDSHLRNGLNVHAGKIACLPVAQAHGHKYVDPATLLTA
ncbi:MAG: alanine dehydrogenase [Burkholderiales bacterium]|nr:alanine dehydrogenase [Burkholderiales bacterium]